MSELDVHKQGQALVLTNQGPGYCRRECRTIAKACDGIMDKLENDELADALDARAIETHIIGGAKRAAELDAKRAILEAAELAARL